MFFLASPPVDYMKQKNSCALYAIISEGCKLGAWARVEGTNTSADDKLSIAILAKDVHVKSEVSVRRYVFPTLHLITTEYFN